jgi:hypothetical protein
MDVSYRLPLLDGPSSLQSTVLPYMPSESGDYYFLKHQNTTSSEWTMTMSYVAHRNRGGSNNTAKTNTSSSTKNGTRIKSPSGSSSGSSTTTIANNNYY